MRLILLAATLAASAAIPISTASAHPHGGYRNTETRQELRECRRELRRADSRREYRRELRECRRELRDARWDDRRRGPPHGNAWGHRRYWDGHRWRYRW